MYSQVLDEMVEEIVAKTIRMQEEQAAYEQLLAECDDYDLWPTGYSDEEFSMELPVLEQGCHEWLYATDPAYSEVGVMDELPVAGSIGDSSWS